MTDRAPLSRDRIAHAALGYINAHGEAALSMRKLGAELGVEAMSLYNHVDNKDDLLDAVADLLYLEVLDRYAPEPDWSWQHETRELTRLFRTVAYENRGAFGVMAERGIPSSVKYAFLQRVWMIFTKAGFSTKDAALAFDTISGWAVGMIRSDLVVMSTIRETRVDDVDDPSAEVQAVLAFADACEAWTPEQRFEFGLDTLIAGIETRLGGHR